MPDRDPDHWLYRLTPDEWLAAAGNELIAAERALAGKQQRAGVTQARRAAGMAWNAVLCHTGDETGYGRSYMEHLQILARDPSVPELVQRAARALLDAPLTQQLVQLGPGDTQLARAAETILTHARARLSPSATT